ncbi:alpha,alpha-trehalase [Nibrella viscosa]|uniref:Alpha,alpha-trehalase n=1 Tax=Nibrella viscosa TaxID=1084524 RepID=A0ABP8JZC1_9BACT
MRRLLLFFWYQLAVGLVQAQVATPVAPDKVYGELFVDVQMARIFPDSKTFVDCIPKRAPIDIINDYRQIKANPAIRFSLERFVQENFELPAQVGTTYQSDRNEDVKSHIRELWAVLKRTPDQISPGSSLLPLPNAYIVPGGRFREVYYWDSYFTMLGLQESGEEAVVENMIRNFAYLISTYNHIPNGNRTYYLSRSQPPFFSLMVELLAARKGEGVYQEFLPALRQEYDYWMDNTKLTKHVVRMPNGSLLNRYYDQDVIPRQESFYEDSVLARESNPADRAALYRHLRSGAESGWDFSTRWFADGENLATIRTTDIVPVDLNGLLYHLEVTLSRAYAQTGNSREARNFRRLAYSRQKAINKYCWNPQDGWYYDYVLPNRSRSREMTIAGMSPFFFRIAPHNRIGTVTAVLEQNFLKPGGVVTTLKTSGQQWDAPNGWAPLQWMTVQGLENYGRSDLAREIARRWAGLNIRVYKATGKLMEKYNVIDTNLEAGGGEYPSQDGFGWTNGVLLKLMNTYKVGE